MNTEIYDQLLLINQNLETIKLFVTCIFLYLVIRLFFNFLSSIIFG